MGDDHDGCDWGPDRTIDASDFIIELRTHGVSGTPPESMLNTSAVVQVWGDETGRFFRPSDTLGNDVWEVASIEVEGATQPVRRFREGYHWGKMTSGGRKQALWALLVPFALVNLSQWMVPPATPGRCGVAVVAILRALVRVVGLGLTIVLMAQWTVLVADIVAVQCLSQRVCLESVTPVNWFRDHPLAITIAVLLAVAVPVFLASRITVQSREKIGGAERSDYNGARVKQDAEAARAELKGAVTEPIPNIARPDFYERRGNAPARTLHAMVGLAGAAMVLSGGASALSRGAVSITWWIALVIIVIGVVFALFMDDPRGSGGRFWRGRWVTLALFDHSRWRGLWWGAAALDLIAAAYFSFMPMLDTPASGWTDGIDALLQSLFVALAVLCLAALVVALVAAWRSRRAFFGDDRKDAVPKEFRPWAWGIAAAVVLPFAALLGAGLGTGLAQTAQNCLTTGCKPRLLSTPPDDAALADIVLPTSYDAIALLWGITGAVVLAAALVLLPGGRLHAAVRRRFDVPELVQGGDSSLRTTWFLAGIKVRADRILFGVVLVAVIAGAVSALVVPTRFVEFVDDYAWVEWIVTALGLVWLADWLGDDTRDQWVQLLQSVGLLVLGAIIIGLLYAIYNAYRRPDSAGRSLGVLWDLASFWPTESHPLVPPCYARKAIDDLTVRVLEYRRHYPNARIVLCGHSQGSTLMYATVLRLAKLDAGTLSKVGLVTHGSQLQWAYGRAFPDMLSYFSHLEVMTALDRRWHNLVRFSDPLGGPVLSWNRKADGGRLSGAALPIQHPDDPTRRTTEREAVYQPTSRAWVLGNERWLPDPVLHEPIFPARAHSDYTLDAQWDDAVALAAGVRPHPDSEPPVGLPSSDESL